MQRTMRLAGKPGSPSVTDNIRVYESAQEIAYRPVVNNIEGVEQRIFALRTDPLRFEMHSRNSMDEMPLSAEHVAHLDQEAFKGGLHKPKLHTEGLKKSLFNFKI